MGNFDMRKWFGRSALQAQRWPSERGWHPSWLIGLCSFWIAAAGNLPLWNELSDLNLLHGGSGLLLLLGMGGVIVALLCMLLALLAWRHTLKPALALCLLATAFGAHFMLSYHVVIDTTMMTNVLQTNPREAGDLLSLKLLRNVGLLGVLPLVLLWRVPVRYGRSMGRRVRDNLLLLLLGLLLAVAAVLASFQPFSTTMRNHKGVRYLINPLNAFYALGDLAAEPLRRKSGPLQPLGTDAKPGPSFAASSKPPLVVLVLGETARADHFSLNGYARPTSPELAKADVISQHNVWSCGTSTAASVPCLFSHLGREGFESRAGDFETLPDVLQHAGLAVLWIDNQAGCKGVCDRVPNVRTSDLKHPQLCADGECFDEIMLDGLDERIAALPAERRARGVVLLMHQMGSHGPAYYKRSPPAYKRFLPECTKATLQDCSRDEVVNAYDNSIAYTDHFLATTIGWLNARAARYDTALLYLSDHGESLGENNLYLHGLPYGLAPDTQKHVPWVTWLSPAFAQRRGVDVACLRGRLDDKRSHDDYFHSVLGLIDVQTGVYQPELDLYRGCLVAPAAAR
ncbi:MAG: phosphoethanolamine transferase [Leptothrix sp. (in: b-proteobacteria)]